MNQNLLRQVKLIIYKLKRSYGLELHIWHPISMENNVETGKIAREYSIMYIRQAILLPRTFARDFEYDLTYIASGKNFVYGGYFDSAKRNIILDVDDLPSNFEITNNDFVVFQEKRWELADISLAEHNQAYFLIAKQVASYDGVTPSYQITGTSNFRILGEYYSNGIFNSQLSYCLHNGKYWLWYDITLSSWIISSLKGVAGTFYWIKGDATIIGSYLPQGTALGTVIVTAI